VLNVTLVGYGAVGRTVLARLAGNPVVRIAHVIVHADSVDRVQKAIGPEVLVADKVPADATLVLECAGHGALADHVLPALQRGIPCAVLSVGALSEAGLAEQFEAAARQGGTQLHLLPGAIGGIDAIAAARLAGLDEVTYTGRKPPQGWRGSPAEALCDLDHLSAPVLILEASAREAARLYPKNANVAATVALAGLGLDATTVRLYADPGVQQNVHEISLRGVFGEMQLTLRGKPLADNPKTSTLTVLSALRFLNNRADPITM
jgi:aspartate dehydrogenase